MATSSWAGRGARPRVSVVVVSYNSADVIEACLGSLRAAASGVELAGVVVVDNGSRDATVDIVRRCCPTAEVVVQSNLGSAAGLTAGFVRCRPDDDVVILNPDSRPGAGSLRAMSEAVSRGVGLVVPRLYDSDGELAFSLRRAPTLRTALGEALVGGERAGRWEGWGEIVANRSAYEQQRPADWATGAVMLITAACRRVVGPWDESFLLYGEETDFALRAKVAGLSLVYTPTAVAHHAGGESNTSPLLWSLLTTNRVKLYRKRHGPASSAMFWLIVALNEALRACAGRATAKAALAALLLPRRRVIALQS